MFNTLKRDFRACFDRDPAARTALEVILTYPGLHAIFLHRVAHWFHTSAGLKLIARMLSHFNRWITGIEIHPGAAIGPGFFIDHGMGVVIGETAVVEDDVTLFQGVTLGGTGTERGKRHPTLKREVVVGTGANILGDIVVGEGSRIGAGSVVIQDVEPNSTVVGIPARVVKKQGEKIDAVSLDHTDLPDPVIESVHTLQERVQSLEHELNKVREQLHGDDERDSSDTG